MKYLFFLIATLLTCTGVFGQKTIGVSKVEHKSVQSHNEYEVHTDNGDSITFLTKQKEHLLHEVYADDDFLIALIKTPTNDYFINASYLKNDQWVQDYLDIALIYPSTSLNTVAIDAVRIIDGSTLETTYTINGFQNETVTTLLSLEPNGIYDHHLGRKINYFHSNSQPMDSSINPRIRHSDKKK